MSGYYVLSIVLGTKDDDSMVSHKIRNIGVRVGPNNKQQIIGSKCYEKIE